jgi:hypothetical protein
MKNVWTFYVALTVGMLVTFIVCIIIITLLNALLKQIGEFGRDASSYVTKYSHISAFIRKPDLIYDFATILQKSFEENCMSVSSLKEETTAKIVSVSADGTRGMGGNTLYTSQSHGVST